MSELLIPMDSVSTVWHPSLGNWARFPLPPPPGTDFQAVGAQGVSARETPLLQRDSDTAKTNNIRCFL